MMPNNWFEADVSLPHAPHARDSGKRRLGRHLTRLGRTEHGRLQRDTIANAEQIVARGVCSLFGGSVVIHFD